MQQGVKAPQHPSSKETLGELGLFNLAKRRHREDLITVYKYLEERWKESRARLFSVGPRGRTGGNGHRLKYRRCHMNIRKHFFLIVRVTALARFAQGSCKGSCTKSIQKTPGHRPGKPALGDPARAGRLDKMTFRGFFQPTLFHPV